MNDTLWIETYRPSTLEDLCISEDIKNIVRGFGQNIPNLLFCGIQGTGKTTLAKIIVHDILKCDYLYINASDESGVDSIRTKVSGFSQTKSFDGNLKVVVLDEADFLSGSAQALLRNLMESYHKTTRFILTGNYKHKIIPALQSRCQNLELFPVFKDSVFRCFNILKNEGIETSKDDKKSVIGLVKRYFPDVRKCINELQKYSSNGKINIPKTIDNQEIVSRIWANILKCNSFDSRKFLIETSESFNSDWDKILTDLLNYIFELSNYDENKKKAMIIIIADHLDKSTRVIDKEINTFACLLNLESVLD